MFFWLKEVSKKSPFSSFTREIRFEGRTCTAFMACALGNLPQVKNTEFTLLKFGEESRHNAKAMVECFSEIIAQGQRTLPAQAEKTYSRSSGYSL